MNTGQKEEVIRPEALIEPEIGQVVDKGGESLWQDAFRRLLKNKLAVAGGITVILLTMVAILAPVLAPYGFAEGDFAANYSPPGGKYLLGADFMGRDMLSRLLYGTRISLLVGALGALFAFVVGLFYGTISGYYGGRLDNVMMRIVDILYAFPGLLFIILLMVTFKSSFGTAIDRNAFVRAVAALDSALGGMLFILIGISITSWVGQARMSRGMALSLRETEFVQAAKALGGNDVRIIVKHIAPNLVGPLIVRVTLAIPGFIATEAFLSFIGLGIDPPTPSWGAMIQEGFRAMRSHPHLAIFPGLALAITMLAFNFLGDGLRDALDPRMKQ
jgi:oligopeptide transport system permease protein